MILKIDHIGIAVRRAAERLPFWTESLGLTAAGRERVESEGVEVVFLPAGDSRLELLESIRPGSTIERFLEKRGEGIHHLTFQVEALEPLLGRLRERGVALLDDAPRTGAGGTRVAFVHPKASGGVLVELVERPEAEPATLVPGAPVLVYLRDPHEKMWGLLRARDASGLVVEGMDLASFEDWMRQIERGEPASPGPSVAFLPMGRVERVLLDRSQGGLPSLADRFRQRTGRRVADVIGGGD